MGQYYTPVILDEDAQPVHAFNSHNYGNGAKLMEHSWLRNAFTNAVVNHIIDAGRPLRLAWAGDYADNESDSDLNLCDIAYENEQIFVKGYDTTFRESYRFLANEDKREYVDLTKLPADRYGWRIHPLPLLTAEGNGRGGGDYRGYSIELVGSWARGHITLTEDAPADYEELIPDFTEDR